jgi:hypothetical protein
MAGSDVSQVRVEQGRSFIALFASLPAKAMLSPGSGIAE